MTWQKQQSLTTGQKLINTLFWLSSALLIFCFVWLGNTGIQVSRVAEELSGRALVPPVFDQALKEAGLANPAARSAPDPALMRAAMPTQIFEWLAEFENSRAMEKLQSARAVIKGVAPASVIERLGVRAGDEVVNFNDGPVDSVYALHTALSKDPVGIEQTHKLTVRRYARVINFPIVIAPGTATDLASLGFVFDMPGGVNLVGKARVASQASEYEERYAKAFPPEWRSAYRESLADFAWQLKQLGPAQAVLGASDAGFIRVDQLIAWHRDAFSAEIDRHLSGVTQSTDTQLRSLRGAVDAILGTLCAAALFALAFVLRRRALIPE